MLELLAFVPGRAVVAGRLAVVGRLETVGRVEVPGRVLLAVGLLTVGLEVLLLLMLFVLPVAALARLLGLALLSARWLSEVAVLLRRTEATYWLKSLCWMLWRPFQS